MVALLGAHHQLTYIKALKESWEITALIQSIGFNNISFGCSGKLSRHWWNWEFFYKYPNSCNGSVGRAVWERMCRLVPPVALFLMQNFPSKSLVVNLKKITQNFISLFSAILNLKKKPKEIAVEDLTTNTRIGPIFPNLFNLAVLVLNDDNLNALNVPAKKPLQSNVLDMVDALCSNPCSLDTNIQQQVKLYLFCCHYL